MKTNKQETSDSTPVRTKKASTPEGRELQMIALATNLAEKQLREGTASSQVITHYLKLGTTMAKLEKEKLEVEKKLAEAKIKSLGSTEEAAQRYIEAVNAIKLYNGAFKKDEDE